MFPHPHRRRQYNATCLSDAVRISTSKVVSGLDSPIKPLLRHCQPTTPPPTLPSRPATDSCGWERGVDQSRWGKLRSSYPPTASMPQARPLPRTMPLPPWQYNLAVVSASFCSCADTLVATLAALASSTSVFLLFLAARSYYAKISALLKDSALLIPCEIRTIGDWAASYFSRSHGS